jgi:hypothetical protein
MIQCVKVDMSFNDIISKVDEIALKQINNQYFNDDQSLTDIIVLADQKIKTYGLYLESIDLDCFTYTANTTNPLVNEAKGRYLKQEGKSFILKNSHEAFKAYMDGPIQEKGSELIHKIIEKYTSKNYHYGFFTKIPYDDYVNSLTTLVSEQDKADKKWILRIHLTSFYFDNNLDNFVDYFEDSNIEVIASLACLKYIKDNEDKQTAILPKYCVYFHHFIGRNSKNIFDENDGYIFMESVNNNLKDFGLSLPKYYTRSTILNKYKVKELKNIKLNFNQGQGYQIKTSYEDEDYASLSLSNEDPVSIYIGNYMPVININLSEQPIELNNLVYYISQGQFGGFNKVIMAEEKYGKPGSNVYGGAWYNSCFPGIMITLNNRKFCKIPLLYDTELSLEIKFEETGETIWKYNY